MRGLPKRIMEHAQAHPEATPLCPGALLHLGHRAAIDQALSRLARSGELMRVCQGVYMRPVETRFGLRAPRLGKALAALSALRGETIVPCGGAAANRLGLTTQNPVRAVYLTSGPNRRLHFGSSVVELRHAPRCTRGPAPQGRRCHPRTGMARSGRGRGWAGSGPAHASRRGPRRTVGRASHHAELDGATGERPPVEWLRRGIRTFRPTTGATPCRWRSAAATIRRTFGTGRVCGQAPPGSSSLSADVVDAADESRLRRM